MAHQIPKELKGEERYFTIPVINLHYSRKGTIYAAVATGISVLIKKLTNVWVFIPTFLILNAIAYPLAHATTPKKKFEGGNLPFDIWLIRWFKFRKMKKKLYIRGRVE